MSVDGDRYDLRASEVRTLATVGAYEALLEDQLVNRMLGMRLYELTDRPVRPFLGAQAQRSSGRADSGSPSRSSTRPSAM